MRFCFSKKSIVFSISAILMLVIFSYSFENSFAQTREEKQLMEELERIEAEQAELQASLNKQKAESATIQRDVNILSSQINQAELNIRKKNLEIEKLKGDIELKKNTIGELNNKLDTSKQLLSQIIRRKHEINQTSIPEILLASNNISDFFVDVDSYSNIQLQLQKLYEQITDIKNQTEKEQNELTDRQNKEIDARYVIQTEKQVIDAKKNDQSKLLNISKQSEATYQKIIQEKELEAARIRAELIKFQGSGITAREISFGEAYDYAKFASQKTGVRAAFIMAIMQQETGFGANVGGCNILNGETGEGVYIRTGEKSIRNMVPGNFDNFVKITSALGLDWKKTPISCVAYYNNQPYGYGGAMGYTQFIPNTWMLVEARVRQYLGAKVADPWNPQHAVMATAVFLQDLGAAQRTYTAEYNAACRYYGSCAVHAYGASVMNKAIVIQIAIDKLEN